MNLYLANGRYVGLQAEARKLDRNFRPVVVPVDKGGLILYLNELVRTRASSSAAAPPMAAEHPSRDMSASANLSRMENPGLDVDSIVETILNASGYSLKRFAGAVAVAFTKLGEG